MGMQRAIAVSLVCHLFCFSFVCLKFDKVDTTPVGEKIHIGFLGSWLMKNEVFPQERNSRITINGLDFASGKLPQASPVPHEKPLPSSVQVSSPKHWNKFLVAEKVASVKETAQDKYLSAKPAWDKVNLKLKIE